MDQLIRDYPGLLLSDHRPPCLTLYQPTHRTHPEKAQDPIRFRVLLKSLENTLRTKYPSHDSQKLLQAFEALADDRLFWNHTLNGLAVLGSPEVFRVYKLPRPVAERAVVADSFYTKPLIRILQSADSYQILGLNRTSFTMYEGNRDALTNLPPVNGVRYTLDEKSGAETDAREGAHRAYGRTGARTVAHHGTNVKQDAEDRDTEQFFRAVDDAVIEHYSRPSGRPLLLAALPQHHRLFHSISRNPFLIDEGIEANPRALSLKALNERAWSLVQPHYLQRLEGLVSTFAEACGSGLGAENLDAIAAAASEGKVETLLVEADRMVPGKLSVATPGADADSKAGQDVDDLLDELSESVLKKGGEVVVVPTERMPTQSGAAAIFRY